MTAARYPHVCVMLPESEVEPCSVELWELGASGIEERDTTTLSGPEPMPGQAAEPGVMLLAGFADVSAAEAAVQALSPRWRARVGFVEGDAWRHAWKAYFKPTRVGERLVVRPSWEPHEAQAQDLVITIDPGSAFGTGTHETTRLVLSELERRMTPGARVLDLGCGSGILSIACALLGASAVDAIDVDPDAVRVARENVELNGVAARVDARVQRLAEIEPGYPLVLANIETRTLVPMAQSLMARVDDGGTLVLSGVLAPERGRLLEAYGAFEHVRTEAMGEWIALVLRRPASRGQGGHA